MAVSSGRLMVTSVLLMFTGRYANMFIFLLMFSNMTIICSTSVVVSFSSSNVLLCNHKKKWRKTTENRN